MKLTSTLAFTALAALASMPATATIATNSSGNGELFLTIIDRDPLPAVEGDDSRSYTRDLGIRMDAFLPGSAVTAPGYTLVFQPDPTLADFLSQITDVTRRSSLVWNIGAMDSVGVNRYMTTAKDIVDVLASQGGQMPSNQALRTFDDNTSVYLANVNTKGTHPGGDAVNGSSVSSVADGAAYGGSANWGRNWAGSALFDNAAPIGESLNFYLLSTNTAGNSAKSTLAVFSNELGNATWTLGQDGALTFMAPVPEPGEWALMLSGLALVGWAARRRKQQSAAAR